MYIPLSLWQLDYGQRWLTAFSHRQLYHCASRGKCFGLPVVKTRYHNSVAAICHKSWGPGLRPSLFLRQSSFLPFPLIEPPRGLGRANSPAAKHLRQFIQSNSLTKCTLVFNVQCTTRGAFSRRCVHCSSGASSPRATERAHVQISACMQSVQPLNQSINKFLGWQQNWYYGLQAMYSRIWH